MLIVFTVFIFPLVLHIVREEHAGYVFALPVIVCACVCVCVCAYACAVRVCAFVVKEVVQNWGHFLSSRYISMEKNHYPTE